MLTIKKSISIWQRGWFLLFGDVKSQIKWMHWESEYDFSLKAVKTLWHELCIRTVQMCLLEQKVKHLKAAHFKLLLIYRVYLFLVRLLHSWSWQKIPHYICICNRWKVQVIIIRLGQIPCFPLGCSQVLLGHRLYTFWTLLHSLINKSGLSFTHPGFPANAKSALGMGWSIWAKDVKNQ